MRLTPFPTTLPHLVPKKFRSFVSYDRSQAGFAVDLTSALRRHDFQVDEDPLDALAGDDFASVIARAYLFRGDVLIFLLAAEKLARLNVAPLIEMLRFYADHQHMRVLTVAVGPADLLPHHDLVHIQDPDIEYAQARTLARAIRAHDHHEPRRSRKNLTRDEYVVLKKMKWDVGVNLCAHSLMADVDASRRLYSLCTSATHDRASAVAWQSTAAATSVTRIGTRSVAGGTGTSTDVVECWNGSRTYVGPLGSAAWSVLAASGAAPLPHPLWSPDNHSFRNFSDGPSNVLGRNL